MRITQVKFRRKYVPSESEGSTPVLFHAGWRTREPDITKLVVAFRHVANAHEKCVTQNPSDVHFVLNKILILGDRGKVYVARRVGERSVTF